MAHTHDGPEPEPQTPFGREAWDARYRERERHWSGNPNAALVAEVEDLPPATALDAGAGEGGDAVWLARQGWHVTAVDISQVALDRASLHAAESGVEVEWLRVDLTEDPAPATYDLVSAFYLHMPAEPRGRMMRHLRDAVTAGGTLLVVGHDLSDLGLVPRPHLTESGWTTDEVVGLLGEGWTVEVAEARPRPAAHPETGEQVEVHDVVVRARRD